MGVVMWHEVEGDVCGEHLEVYCGHVKERGGMDGRQRRVWCGYLGGASRGEERTSRCG